MNEHLDGWGDTATFGISEGLIFSNGELYGIIDEDGDMAEFIDKKEAAILYAEDIKRISMAKGI